MIMIGRAGRDESICRVVGDRIEGEEEWEAKEGDNIDDNEMNVVGE